MVKNTRISRLWCTILQIKGWRTYTIYSIGSYADGCGSLSEDLPDPLVQGAWAARIEERMELAWRRESGLVDNDVRVQ